MQPYLLKKDEGKSVWFLNTLVTYKAESEATEGGFGLIEQLLPAGFEPPPHVHHREDEAFYVLEGHITFYCNENVFPADTGSFVFFPRNMPHRFKVSDDQPARMLQFNVPGGFEKFHEDMGEPAATHTLPTPTPPDIEKLFRLASQYGFEVLPPAK